MKSWSWLVGLLAVKGGMSTFYYQCMDLKTLRRSHGINNACGKLDNNWCSTNCNWFKKNCQYCEYIPGGEPPGQDVEVLERWCSATSYVDSRGYEHYPAIYRSHYEHLIHCGSCGGCAYRNNALDDIFAPKQSNRFQKLLNPPDYDDSKPTDGMDPIPIDDPDEDAWAQLSLPAKTAAASRSMNCTLLLNGASTKIAANFTSAYPTCTIDQATSPDVKISCEGAGELASDLEGADEQFNELCDEYGGIMFDDADKPSTRQRGSRKGGSMKCNSED